MAAGQPQSRIAFVHQLRKIYHPLGFSKGYNFTLFVIFGGALLGFSLARLEYLDFHGRFCPVVEDSSTTTASDCYWVTSFSRYHVGMLLHLSTVLPAGILAVFQFIPVIRHKFILYHRLAGYLIILLIILGNVGAIMMADESMGGDLASQTFIGFVSLQVLTITTFALAFYNIQRLQIDQHRAWMLRTWFYVGFIISLRIIQTFMAKIISIWPAATLYTIMPCSELEFIYHNNTRLYSEYPSCLPSNSNLALDGRVVVKADFGSDSGQTNVALEVSFAAAGFSALVLHAVGVEIYLKLTSREAERLRLVSYESQSERGMKDPGSMGLVLEKFGDAEPWRPRPELRATDRSEVRVRSDASPVDDAFASK